MYMFVYGNPNYDDVWEVSMIHPDYEDEIETFLYPDAIYFYADIVPV